MLRPQLILQADTHGLKDRSKLTNKVNFRGCHRFGFHRRLAGRSSLSSNLSGWDHWVCWWDGLAELGVQLQDLKHPHICWVDNIFSWWHPHKCNWGQVMTFVNFARRERLKLLQNKKDLSYYNYFTNNLQLTLLYSLFEPRLSTISCQTFLFLAISWSSLHVLISFICPFTF